MYSTGNKTVDIVGKMRLTGNVIPHAWYSQIRKADGKPDMVSILLLSEIVYWYRPKEMKDEDSGQLIGEQKRFASDLLQKSYAGLEKQFGWSEKQIRESLKRMEKMDLVKRVFRDVESDGKIYYNSMFLELNATKLFEITFPNRVEALEPQEDNGPGSLEGNTPLPEKETPLLPEKETPSFPKRHQGGSPNGNTNTENTLTEITPTETTPTKSSSNVDHGNKAKIPYQEIIEYLNQKTGKDFKHTAKAHREKIRGRFEDGFTKEDFMRVIDNKVREWKHSPKMEKFLRPGTLFGQEKFDNYLNEGGGNEVNQGSDLDQYDFNKDTWDDREE